MVSILTAALAWDGIDPFLLVRVEDPDHPGALTRSETGAVIVGPPAPGTPWRWEPLAEIDRSPAWEALEVTNAPLWHDLGHDGTGVKVAVLDPGWGGANTDELGPFTTHDCVAHPACAVPFDPLRVDGNHGVACSEVLHDIAPGAELHLVRISSFTTVENAVRWAIREDVDVLSMSVSFFNDSFHDGTGPFGPLLEDLEAHDILLVTSAGNSAREHWQGPFVDADGDGRLDFDGSNRIEVDFGGDGKRVIGTWNQFGRCGLTDLDLRVVDPETGGILARGEDVQDGSADHCEPIERGRFDAAETTRVAVEVWHRRGASAGLEVSLWARGGAFVEPVPAHSVTVPADHPLAFTVGAVPAADYLTAPPEGFSGIGPNNAGHPKPDIAGPDRLSTDTYGSTGFSGTSAATPVVAGLIAVRMSASGSTPREAARWLQSNAWSDRAVWEADPALGAGKARLPTPEASDPGCGRRPSILPLLLVPLWRRRVRCTR